MNSSNVLAHRRYLGASLFVLGLMAQAGVPAHAATLASLIASKGALTAGDVVFDGFALGNSPLLSPQGATVAGGGQDIDITASLDASGQATLHLVQINPASQAPQALTVDLAAKGTKDQLRNVVFKATVKNPALRLVAMTQTVGPGTHATGEVTGSVFSYAMVAQPAPAAALPGQISFYNFSQVSALGSNSPSLPSGHVSSQIFDTAWLLTTAHAKGKAPSGVAQIDRITLSFATGAP